LQEQNDQQLAPNDLLAHSISQLAPNDQLQEQNDQQLAPNALLVHSISQLATFQNLLVIVAPQQDATANHILSLRHVGATLQKISVQMIRISRQIWQMPISSIQHRGMRLRNHSATLVFQQLWLMP
jgi:uncharacterized membrane protein YciS (DUF1049 family)